MSDKQNWIKQNPVDWYNENKRDSAIKLLTTKFKTLREEGGDIYERKGRENKKMILKSYKGVFKTMCDNTFGFDKDLSYSPFQILTNISFNNNFWGSFNYVGVVFMDMDFPYIRVGINYWKVIRKTDRYNVVREELTKWNKDTIVNDYGKDMLIRVNLYDDFTIVPDNKNYLKNYKSFYNLYAPFHHSPKEFDITKLEKIKWSLELVRHIFGEQYELGLSYLKVLYDTPKQALPILVLTSEERSTGKSTFVDWLSVIFGGNMVIINPQDISSSFNSSYATKNIIAIEESKFDSTQATEKLKALATQKSLSVNTKHVSEYTTPFFGKLIITSNDESKFSKVDQAEIRYWVRSVPTLKGKANHNILNDLTKEIPNFLHYLDSLAEIDYTKSRQVFTSEEIGTDALETVKKESKPELQKEIEILLDDWCSNNEDEEFLYFIASDIKDFWFEKSNNYQRNYILRILRDYMNMSQETINSRYNPTFNKNEHTKTGKFFTYENPYYNNTDKQTEINLNSKDDVPF